MSYTHGINAHGNWEARSTVPLPGHPGVEMTVLTAKRYGGALTTSISCSRMDKHGMRSHMVYQDYSDSRVIHRRVPRCTENVVVQQHLEALKDHLETHKKIAQAHYTVLAEREAGGPI